VLAGGWLAGCDRVKKDDSCYHLLREVDNLSKKVKFNDARQMQRKTALRN
jgi:hypothetical protein